MTIEQAFKATTGLSIEEGLEKAIEGGWESDEFFFVAPTVFGSIYRDWQYIPEKVFLDPLFWQSLYGSEKYGRIKAIEFINAIFDGKSAEKFFEQESDLGKEQQEKALS